MENNRFMKVASAVSLALLIAACGGGGGGGGTVYGRIIGYSTRAGIQDAQVTLYNDVWGTSSGTSTTTSDTEGFFKIGGVTPGDHLLEVATTGYATHRDWITLQDGDSIVAAGTEGKIALQLGCNITVYTTHNGSAVAGATVFVDSTATDPAGAGNADRNVFEISATIGTDGNAVLSGLGQESVYNLVVPAFDSNGDGTYDYQTTLTANFACTDDATTHTMELTEAGRDDAIAVVGGNFGVYDGIDSGVSDISLGPNDPLVLVFNYPISAPAGAESWTSDDRLGGLAAPAAINFTAALSAGDTILTLTPAAALTQNETYTLAGSVEAIINGVPSYSPFTNLGVDDIYVFRSAAVALTEVVARSVTGNLNLEFPEAVNGRATIKSTTVGGVTTVRQTEVNIGTGGALAVQGGAVIWRVNTGIALATGSTTVVYINANDMDGNIIQGEVTLAVQ